MARELLFAAATACLMAQAAPAMGAKPNGDFKIETSDARCVLVRQFTDGDKPITLALKAPPTGSSMQLAVIRQAYRKTNGQTGATVGIDGKPYVTFALGYPLGYPAKSSKQSVSLIHLPSEAADAIRKARHVDVSVKGSFHDGFELGDPAHIWPMMDSCLERLRQTWNIGSTHGADIRMPARALVPLQGMISPQDFPPQVLQNVWKGQTTFMLLVDEGGKVKDCTLTESSGIAVVDSRTCAIVTHKARFEPAIGGDGKPAKSVYQKSITWRVTD